MAIMSNVILVNTEEAPFWIVLDKVVSIDPFDFGVKLTLTTGKSFAIPWDKQGSIKKIADYFGIVFK